MVFCGIIGIITATAQHWLVRKRRNCAIRGWHGFTIVGWIFAGIALWGFRYGYPRMEFTNTLMFGAFLMIPALFQAVPLSRVFKRGWMWAVIGIFAGLLAMFIRGTAPLRMADFYGTTFAGFALSFSTAIVLLRLQFRDQKTRLALAAANDT